MLPVIIYLPVVSIVLTDSMLAKDVVSHGVGNVARSFVVYTMTLSLVQDFQEPRIIMTIHAVEESPDSRSQTIVLGGTIVTVYLDSKKMGLE